MPTPPIPRERQERYKRLIEESLRDGFDPYRQSLGGRGSALCEAVRRLRALGHDDSENKLQGWIRRQEALAAKGEEHLLPDWSLFARRGVAPAEIRKGRVERWIVTAAQDDTDVHPRFWSNLQAYARHIGAEIVVGGYTYSQRVHTDRQTLTAQYRPELQPHLRFDRMEMGPVLYAPVNILPTASRPLFDLLTYSQGRPAIFPHAKHALEVAPAMPGLRPAELLTSGCCTLPNYIPKKAGQKAEFHHVLGCVVVEVAGPDAWWCRHVSAASDGSFQDLDATVRDGSVLRNNRVKAVTLGDIHFRGGDMPAAAAHLWGAQADSLLDALRPEYAFLHDLCDFPMTSRHVDGDALHAAEMQAAGTAGIRAHVQGAAHLLRQIERAWCRLVVVESNHDRRLERWVTGQDGRSAPLPDALYWHELNVAALQARQMRDETFNLFRWALQQADARRLEGIEFVPEGGSFVICQDSGGIECGAHGHHGPNGARGSIASLSRVASKMNIGHGHTPGLRDGVAMAGVSGHLDQGYNKGPSGWMHAHVVTYPNGKRAILIQSADGRWRA